MHSRFAIALLPFVAPVQMGALKASRTRPSGSTRTASWATGGRSKYLHIRSSRLRSRPSMTVAACNDIPKAETSSARSVAGGTRTRCGDASESCTHPASAWSVSS
jgi:hypothetical protein